MALVAPECRVFAPQPDGRAVTLWTELGRTVESLRQWSEDDATAYVEYDRGVRSLAASSPTSVTRRRRRSRRRASATRCWASGSGGAFRGLGKRRRPDDPARPRDGRRRLRLRVVRDRGDPRDHGLARRPLHGDGAVVRRDDRRCCSPIPRATTAAPRARPCTPRAARSNLVEAIAASARASGAEIRTGARVAQVTTVDGAVTGVVLECGEEIAAARASSRASIRSGC